MHPKVVSQNAGVLPLKETLEITGSEALNLHARKLEAVPHGGEITSSQ